MRIELSDNSLQFYVLDSSLVVEKYVCRHHTLQFYVLDSGVMSRILIIPERLALQFYVLDSI